MPPPPIPPLGNPELTPAWVAAIDDAVICPFDVFTPETTTESPGFRAESEAFAFRDTVVEELSETLTRLPEESVT